MKYTDKQIEELLQGIYDGTISTSNLPEDLYLAIGEYLKEAVYKGFGGTLADFSGASQELLNELRESVYMFSGAKTYQAINDISLVKDNTDIKSYREFRDEALKIYDQYNVNWLETEYSTAIGQAQNAVRWDQIQQQKDVLPYLRYSDVEDDNECEICEPLGGIERPVDDPFWDEYMPLNHFNCRCTVEQIDHTEYKETSETDLEERTQNARDEMQPMFLMNPGKDGYIFSPEHPYYDIAPRDREAAKDNFGLPIPEAPEMKVAAADEFVNATTIKGAENYALDNLGVQYANFKGVNLNVVNALNKELFSVKKVFPELQVNALGSAQETNKIIKAEIVEAFKKTSYYDSLVKFMGQEKADKRAASFARKVVPKVGDAYAYSWQVPKFKIAGEEIDLTKYRGVYVNTTSKDMKNTQLLDAAVKKNMDTGWFAKGREDASYIMQHEFGHEIDALINFKKDPDFRVIFAREHKNGLDAVADRLSRYGATAGRRPENRDVEMIAEAWAEFMSSKAPRELATEIGDLMLKTYYEQFIQGTGTTYKNWFAETMDVIKTARK